jgi:putative zinc finger protein
MTHPNEETLNDYVERELSPAEQVRVATHVEACGECALVVAEIQQVVRDAAALGPIPPPPHVWALIQTRLAQSTVHSPQSIVGSPESTVQSPWSRVQSPWSRVHSPWSRVHSPQSGVGRGWSRFAWAAATAALVVMAFLTGRFLNVREEQRAVDQVAGPAPQVISNDATVRERVLLIAVGDHLERSQMVLVELAHAETRDELDISAERQLADDLLASNRLYRQTAQQMGQTNVAGILDELERVLVEVARGPSTVSIQQLADIQQRIESQGILFKVKVIGSDIRKPPVL